MASIDDELQRRGSSGQIVLVGAAVLTKNVPDITDKLKDAVYASGVARPKQESALELPQLDQQALLAAEPQAVIPGQPAEPPEYQHPMVSAKMPQTSPIAQPQTGPPGASAGPAQS